MFCQQVPPHPALRPAGRFDPQGQHHKDPRLALRPAPGTGHCARSRNRDHSTHLGQTAPLLLQSNAHHRALRGGKIPMSRAPRWSRQPHDTPPVRCQTTPPDSLSRPPRTDCACPYSVRHTAAITPERAAGPDHGTSWRPSQTNGRFWIKAAMFGRWTRELFVRKIHSTRTGEFR